MAPPTHQEQLSAYLDGELEDAEAARLEAELRVNPALRSELDELREVAAFLRTQGPARAPGGFHARVMRAVEAEAPATPWWAWLRRPFGVPIEGLAIAAAAAAVLLLAIPDDPAPDAVATEAASAGAHPAGAVANDQAAAKRDANEAEDPASDGVAVLDELEVEQELTEAVQGKLGPMPKRAGEASPSGGASSGSAPTSLGTKDQGAAEALADPSTGSAPIVTKSSAPTPSAGTDAATVTTDGTADGTAIEGAAAGKPLGRTAGYSYEVYADDPGVLGELQRIAGRYQGRVNDMSGTVVSGTQQPTDEAVYAIRIPASSLQSFHREIQRIGVRVTPAGDNRIFADEFVDIAVTVRLTGPPTRMKAVDAYEAQ